MPQELTVIVLFLVFIVLLFTSISTGLGFWALTSSPSCTTTIRDYVHMVSVISAFEVAVCTMFITTTLLSYKCFFLHKYVDLLTYLVSGVLVFLSGLSMFILFFWGTYLLITQDQCRGTPIFGVSVWFLISGVVSILRIFVGSFLVT